MNIINRNLFNICLTNIKYMIFQEEKYYDANGKKKKGVVSTDAQKASRGCMSIITCGLLGWPAPNSSSSLSHIKSSTAVLYVKTNN